MVNISEYDFTDLAIELKHRYKATSLKRILEFIESYLCKQRKMLGRLLTDEESVDIKNNAREIAKILQDLGIISPRDATYMPKYKINFSRRLAR